GVYVGDDDVAGASVPANWNGHATDRSRAGDKDVLADEIEGKRGMHGVSQRIEAGKNIERNRRIGMPCIGRRNSDEFGPGTGTINSDALCVRAKVPATG